MELDYITVSRLLLVPVVNAFESIKNWFQLVYQNLSWLQYCVLLPCVWLRNILREWFVTTVTLPTHALQPQNFVRIFCNDSEAIFCVFQLFSQEIKYFYQKNTWNNSKIIFIWACCVSTTEHYDKIAVLWHNTRVRHCDTTRTLAMSTRPRPSHAMRKDKLVRTAAFQASRY